MNVVLCIFFGEQMQKHVDVEVRHLSLQLRSFLSCTRAYLPEQQLLYSKPDLVSKR